MIEVICTGRGTHAPEVIATVDESDPMHPQRVADAPWRYEQQMSSSTARPGYDPLYVGTYHFPCPDNVCRRDPQLVREKWQLLIEHYIAIGRTTLDVSSLPF